MINDSSTNKYDGILELEKVRLPLSTSSTTLNSYYEILIDFRRFEERKI